MERGMIVWLFNVGLAAVFAVSAFAALCGAAVASWHRDWVNFRLSLFCAVMATFLAYVFYGCRDAGCNLEDDGIEYYRR